MRIKKALQLFKKPLKSLRDMVLSLAYRGQGRYCPVCQRTSRKFGKFGLPPRQDARCMHCKALERHRLAWLYFQKRTSLFAQEGLKMLHIAPEAMFVQRFKQILGDTYITADISDPRASVQMDITQIQYPPESFDVIYCSHVLEHVSDDRKAMGEFFRILKPQGWAILLVPITAKKTFEDPSITDPARRLEVFGQKDHLRCYGPDYADRLREKGFYVKVTYPPDFLTSEEIKLMGLANGAGEIYYCTKSE